MDKYIARSPETAARALGDETIIMSTVDSTLFSLNPTGSVIWQAANGSASLSSIIENRVCAEFEVTPEQARADAEGFVAELVEHGILLISDEPFNPTEVA